MIATQSFKANKHRKHDGLLDKVSSWLRPGDQVAEGKEPLNIFTIASGHMYERLQKIMILSVIKNTKYVDCNIAMGFNTRCLVFLLCVRAMSSGRYLLYTLLHTRLRTPTQCTIHQLKLCTTCAVYVLASSTLPHHHHHIVAQDAGKGVVYQKLHVAADEGVCSPHGRPL